MSEDELVIGIIEARLSELESIVHGADSNTSLPMGFVNVLFCCTYFDTMNQVLLMKSKVFHSYGNTSRRKT